MRSPVTYEAGGSPVELAPSAEQRWSRADAVRIVAAIGLLAGGAAVALGDVPGLERSLYLRVNGLSDQLYWPLWVPMQLGSLGGGLALAVLLGWRTRRRSVGITAVGAVLAAWVLAKVVKEQIGRGRPKDEGIDTILHEPLEGGLGFVSGHAVLVFALYAVAAPHLPRPWRWAALVLAAIVSIARVYMGAHLPLDVISGAGLGLLVGELFRLLEARWADRHAPEDTVAAS